MFDRLELLIGKDSLNKLKEKHVLILGLGGVGGTTLEALVRSGIGHVTIVDNDKIDITNLNRQIISTNDNLGKYKTDEFVKRILSINSEVNIEKITDFITEDNIDKLFLDNIDYFIDACDTVSTKKLVIDKCLEKNIKFITCLGTGKRLDPSKLVMCDLRDTKNDPIARILRKHVKDNNITSRITCCYSEEEPIKKEGRVIPSSIFVPSSAGLLIASCVIRDLIK